MSPTSAVATTLAPCVLVTGAARRIGRAIAEVYARQGWAVALHYRHSSAQALELQLELLALGAPAVHLVRADLTDARDRKELLSQVLAQAGRLDALINSAAAFEYDTALSASADALQQHVQTNFVAPTELTLLWAQARQKKSQGCGAEQGAPGHVVTLLDQKLQNLNPDYCTYTLSKLAAASSIRFLAQACAPWLRVNAVSPGVTLPSSDMQDALFEQASAVAALGRSSRAQDIADAVWSLQSLPAVTGQNLVVDGGQHLVPRRRDVAFEEKPLHFALNAPPEPSREKGPFA